MNRKNPKTFHHELPAPIDLPKTQRAKIRLLICDVDGVLTDGTLSYTAQGEEIKHFNAKDGLGLKLLMHHGIDVAIITARDSKPLTRRMKDLGIQYFYPGQDNKTVALEELLKKLEIEPEQVAYMGDDLLDLPVMRQIGLAITVADGHVAVKQEADAVTELAGGRGAVREVADALMDAQQPITEAYDHFLATQLGTRQLTTA